MQWSSYSKLIPWPANGAGRFQEDAHPPQSVAVQISQSLCKRPLPSVKIVAVQPAWQVCRQEPPRAFTGGRRHGGHSLDSATAALPGFGAVGVGLVLPGGFVGCQLVGFSTHRKVIMFGLAFGVQSVLEGE